MSSELSAFLSAIMGVSMCSSVIFSIWICVKRCRNENQTIHWSPFLLSSCFSDVLLVSISGPTICVCVSQSTWESSKTASVLLDILFLALFWSSTLSHLIYTLDRHCLIVARILYPETFGRFTRNAVTIVVIWLLSVSMALLYMSIRQASNKVPMTYLFTPNILYCFVVIVVMYAIPVMIITVSLIKVKVSINRKHARKPCLRGGSHIKPSRPLVEDINSFTGTSAASGMFVITSLPWIIFELLKTLQLLDGNSTLKTEIILLSLLVTGIGLKSGMYVLCTGFLRRSFFSKLFQQNENFTLEQPAVVTNNAVL